MRRDVLTEIGRIIRTFLLFNVLIGIFFSNAEGIQLLPFPVSATAIETNSLAQGQSYKSYNLSVHNFSLHSFQTKAKSQKNVKEISDGKILANRRFSNDCVVFEQKQKCCQKADSTYDSNILTLPSNRAPPAL